jgi:hypothetical protein
MAYLSTDPSWGAAQDSGLSTTSPWTGQTINQPMTPVAGSLSATGAQSGYVTPNSANAGISQTAQGGSPDLASASQGLGTPDLYDHTQLQKFADNLKAQGYDVQLAPADMYGRIDGLIINGKMTRAFDSTGHWSLDQSPNAWDGGGGGMGGGANWGGTFNMPTLQDLQNYPGAQYAIDEANRALNAGAASKGTLLNARTQEGIAKSLAGFAGSFYPQLFNEALQTHQEQFGNLFNLANLGLNATSVGGQ